MSCPHCRSSATTRRKHRSALGYARFNCRACKRRFNQRTGTPFNQLQYPTDIVLLAVLWRLRYKLSFRDVAELLLQRGFEVTHETIRAWEFRFAPLLADQLRNRRRGRAGVSWYLDETYVKVAGRWCYLYRAIDRDGDLLDSMLSEHRDKHAARRFLRRLIEVAGHKPLRVTTDHHPAYRKAIRWILGRKVLHRRNQSGFNWSLQHLDEEVVDGQASRVDEGVDGAFAYEVAGCAVASPRGPTGVLACDRNWSDERGGRRCGRRVSGSWKSMVQAWWRNATDGSHSAEGPLLVVS